MILNTACCQRSGPAIVECFLCRNIISNSKEIIPELTYCTNCDIAPMLLNRTATVSTVSHVDRQAQLKQFVSAVCVSTSNYVLICRSTDFDDTFAFQSGQSGQILSASLVFSLNNYFLYLWFLSHPFCASHLPSDRGFFTETRSIQIDLAEMSQSGTAPKGTSTLSFLSLSPFRVFSHFVEKYSTFMRAQQKNITGSRKATHSVQSSESNISEVFSLVLHVNTYAQLVVSYMAPCCFSTAKTIQKPVNGVNHTLPQRIKAGE